MHCNSIINDVHSVYEKGTVNYINLEYSGLNTG